MGTLSSRSMVEHWSVRYAAGTEHLPDDLRRAMDQLYLCMRGIDEIEDHPELPTDLKVHLMTALAVAFRRDGAGIKALLAPVDGLAEVTLRIPEWRRLASDTISPRIDETMAALSNRLAFWANRHWVMRSERDLMLYCRDTAAALFVLVDDLFAWGIDVRGDRSISVECGLATQLGNISHGREKDLRRGVDFYPVGWTDSRLQGLLDTHAPAIEAYIDQFDEGPFADWANAYLAGRY